MAAACPLNLVSLPNKLLTPPGLSRLSVALEIECPSPHFKSPFAWILNPLTLIISWVSSTKSQGNLRPHKES